MRIRKARSRRAGKPVRKPRSRNSKTMKFRPKRTLRSRAIPPIRKIEFNDLIGKYFCPENIPEEGKIRMVGGDKVIPYAEARIERLGGEAACHPMKVEGTVFVETKSKNPDTVIRVDQGPIAPLNNQTTPLELPNEIHNYVIIARRNPSTGGMETEVGFLKKNFLEIRSKHAHIILTQLDPERGGDFIFLASGECIYDGRGLLVNIQSGMNWEISVSRPGIYDEIERILPEMAAEGPMGGELAAGVGPKNDFWGAIPVGFFKYVLGIPVVSYTPYPIRKKITAERDKLVREWCPNDVGLELYTNVQGCKERRNPVDLCSGGSIPEQSEEESLEKLTVPKLRKMLEDAGIEIKGRPKKADLIELIREIVG